MPIFSSWAQKRRIICSSSGVVRAIVVSLPFVSGTLAPQVQGNPFEHFLQRQMTHEDDVDVSSRCQHVTRRFQIIFASAIQFWVSLRMLILIKVLYSITHLAIRQFLYFAGFIVPAPIRLTSSAICGTRSPAYYPKAPPQTVSTSPRYRYCSTRLPACE